jgi:beta-N-acetylhexosaminidase
MASVGRLNDPELPKKIAKITSKELIACGINLNFAPVCDVNINLKNEVIGDRSFSPDPNVTAKMVSAYIEGGLGSGMILCAKHFPGHGDTSIDSHFELPVVDKSFEALEKCELVPFRAALEAGVQMVMTSHILFPRIDDKPATMSKKIITDILIKKLMFGGVIISDDMEMGAIAKNYGIPEAFKHSINAGVNMFILSGMQGNDVNVDELIEDIAKVVSTKAIDENKIDLSVKKILDLKDTHLTGSYKDDFFNKAALRKESSLEFARSLTDIRQET